MADLINGTDFNQVQEVTLPSLTYQVVDGHIRGMTDGQSAMQQAVDKIMQTERFVWPIYDNQYGNDLVELLGKDMPYAKNEVRRMLDEAFKSDDRVTGSSIDSITELASDTLMVAATVTTIFGDFSATLEVNV